jgi:hypothetical protein
VDRIDGGDRLDAELRGDQLVLVDVDLGQDHALGRILLGDLLEHGPELLARPAPLGPEIEDHQRVHRWLDDLLLEPLDRLALSLCQAYRCHA